MWFVKLAALPVRKFWFRGLLVSTVDFRPSPPTMVPMATPSRDVVRTSCFRLVDRYTLFVTLARTVMVRLILTDDVTHRKFFAFKNTSVSYFVPSCPYTLWTTSSTVRRVRRAYVGYRPSCGRSLRRTYMVRYVRPPAVRMVPVGR